MSAVALEPKLRSDYRSPPFFIDEVKLRFDLRDEYTLVESELAIRRNPEVSPAGAALVLDAEAMEILTVEVDGRGLAAEMYKHEGDKLHVPTERDAFVLRTQVRIHPEKNTELSGLYRSSGNFCTQCEAEGFRRITPFLDRPDVMARYTTTIVADKERVPVMLSNGNRVEEGLMPDGRRFVRWEDPHKKPSYLFALVAGDLHVHSGKFVTRSGREVALEIWVEPQNIDKCEHALASLQRAMKWDEEVYGLEYDLDIYMIVAVNDFNMGAMENKGLNVFNSKYVLARPETATDDDYEAIEGVIGHEYFHNWTGNRVTCRDWFQLTLKEGLTVFRDQEFSSDMSSKAVKRVHDVTLLRTSQFDEDSGPMAHPVRPESYIEMNNFYTSTVYLKGAEVIRLYHTLLGADGFRRGMDLYFERHDGQAVTCDDFRSAMADANQRDLAQFERWYLYAGTPEVSVRGAYDGARRQYTLTLRQSNPSRPEAEQQPFHIPVRLALLAKSGAPLPLRLEGEAGIQPARERVVELVEREQTFVFSDVTEPPIPSLFRDFSAPVRVRAEQSREELAFLMAHDQDPFNRWDAGQRLGESVLLEVVREAQQGRSRLLDPHLSNAFGRVLEDETRDGSERAQALSLPGERVLAQSMAVVDPDAIHEARRFLVRSLAQAHESKLVSLYERLAAPEPYKVDKRSIDRRRLKNIALRYLGALETPASVKRMKDQFDQADNMTDMQAALSGLVDRFRPETDDALSAFFRRFEADPLVIDKWFTLQATSSDPGTVDRVLQLAKHATFTLSNPNRVRSLLGAFAMSNPVRFHAKDGRGYRLLGDSVLELDALNPQVAARMVSAFNTWRRYDESRQSLMRAELERIRAKSKLSRDTAEIVGRALGA